MKKLMIIAIVLLSISAKAQTQGTKQQKREAAKELRKDMSPEDIARLKSKKMTLYLDLSDAQQQQVYDLLLTNAKKRASVKTERLEKVEGEKTKLTKDEMVARQNQKLDQQIETKRKLKDILTTEQYAKLEKMQAKRQNKSRKKMKHKANK